MESIQFVVPSEEQRLKGIDAIFKKHRNGSLTFTLNSVSKYPMDRKCTPELTKVLEPSIFSPIAQPEADDWLGCHRETGQSFLEFLQYPGNKVGEGGRNTIYIVPLGTTAKDFDEQFLKDLEEYAKAFFCMPVKMLDIITLQDKNATKRKNQYTRNIQYLTGDLFKILIEQLPKNGYCIVGVTMFDLYPDEKWNYVFGQAQLKKRAGVYSFARYDPLFWGEDRGDDYYELLLERSCKVMTHELMHQFGLHHCVYYNCLMTGSNHLEESDKKPMHICPVCYRKLHLAIGFDIKQREQQIYDFQVKHNLKKAAEWQLKQLSRVLGEKDSDSKMEID